jgi:hypothetical protein
MPAPREFGETRAIFAERGQPDFQIVRGPDRLLNLGHRLVRSENPFIDRDVDESLRRRVSNRRPVRKFLGDRERRIHQRVVRNHEIDETPPF